MPLSLLRSSIYGPMEHVLWDAISKKTVDIEETSNRLAQLLWQGLQPPNPNAAALEQLQRDMAAALRLYDQTSSSKK
jgi:hypothetical protein